MSHEQETEKMIDDIIRQRYLIMFDSDFLKLAIAVDKKMKEGWEPCGGMTVDKNYFYQAMTLK